MNYAENKIRTGQSEYDRQFWNFMKGDKFAAENIEAGRSKATGT